MKLFTKAQDERLRRSDIRAQENPDFDREPVVKLFTPDANATWLLIEIDPKIPDIALCLCGLGLGCPELGSVCVSDIKTVRGRFGLPVERDRCFRGTSPLSAYADDTRNDGCIKA